MINYNFFTDYFTDLMKPKPIIEGNRRRRRRRRRERARKAAEYATATAQDPWYFYCPAYMGRYGDLQRAFGTDCNNHDILRSYWHHWQHHGVHEGRQAGIPKNVNEFHCNSYVKRYPGLQTKTVDIAVGSSRGPVKNVPLPADNMKVDPRPLNRQKRRWRDRFSATVSGKTLTVKRIDQPNAVWGQPLVLRGTIPPSNVDDFCNNPDDLKQMYNHWIYHGRHEGKKAGIESRKSAKDGVTLYDGDKVKSMNCPIRFGDQIVFSTTDVLQTDTEGWFGSSVGYISDNKLKWAYGWGFDGGNYQFTPIALMPVNKNIGDIIRFGDQVQLQYKELLANYTGTVDELLTFTKTPSENINFVIRPVIDNGKKVNGDSFEYHDSFILAFSKQTGNTSNCGYYGCSVAQHNKSGLTFGHGEDGKKDKFILYARPPDPFKDLKNTCVQEGPTDFTRNGNSIISIDDGIVTNKLSRVMKPTEQEFQKKQDELNDRTSIKDNLYKQLYVSYDNAENFTPTIGAYKEIEMDKKTIKRKEQKNKSVIEQYYRTKQDQKTLSNNIQDMINNTKKQQKQGFSNYQEGFDDDASYKRNNLSNQIRDIYYVDQQTEELQHEMDKEQQRNSTYMQKSFYQKEQVERLRFWNQHIFVYMYYILAVIALFFLFQQGETTISMKLVYSAIVLCFPFIIYPVEKGLYWIYNYLASFVLGVPHDSKNI